MNQQTPIHTGMIPSTTTSKLVPKEDHTFPNSEHVFSSAGVDMSSGGAPVDVMNLKAK